MRCVSLLAHATRVDEMLTVSGWTVGGKERDCPSRSSTSRTQGKVVMTGRLFSQCLTGIPYVLVRVMCSLSVRDSMYHNTRSHLSGESRAGEPIVVLLYGGHV